MLTLVWTMMMEVFSTLSFFFKLTLANMKAMLFALSSMIQLAIADGRGQPAVNHDRGTGQKSSALSARQSWGELKCAQPC